MIKKLYTERTPLLCTWQAHPQPVNTNAGAYKNHVGKLVILHPVELTEIPIDETLIVELIDDVWQYKGRLVL